MADCPEPLGLDGKQRRLFVGREAVVYGQTSFGDPVAVLEDGGLGCCSQ